MATEQFVHPSCDSNDVIQGSILSGEVVVSRAATFAEVAAAGGSQSRSGNISEVPPATAPGEITPKRLLHEVLSAPRDSGHGSPRLAPRLSTKPTRSRVACVDDFDLLCVLGRGTYGRVLQVRHKASAEVFAMKVFDKRELVKQKQVAYTRVERDIMTRIQHPFLIDLKFCFQTPLKLYLVMDFMGGGELFTHLQEKKLLREDAVRVYAAEIVLAIEYLHSRDIIHRDLKPENVLLDCDGHVRLTDYGLSKMDFADSGSTRTICGTNEYMAPEMLAGGGYGKSVDWWSLGALIYEMLTGDPPFSAKDPKKLAEKIMSERVVLPTYLSSSCHSLLKGLLERNVDKRLGCAKSNMFSTRGVTELKQHPFFKGLDWRRVERRGYEPPIAIALGCQEDTSNFDVAFTSMPVADVLAGAPMRRVGEPGPPKQTPKKKVATPGTPAVPAVDVAESPREPSPLPSAIDHTAMFRGFSFTHPDLESYFSESAAALYSPDLRASASTSSAPDLELAPLQLSALSKECSVDTSSPTVPLPDVSPPALAAGLPANAASLSAAARGPPPGLELDTVTVPSLDLPNQITEMSLTVHNSSPLPAKAVLVQQETPPSAAPAPDVLPPKDSSNAPADVSPSVPAGHATTPTRRLQLRADAPEFRPLPFARGLSPVSPVTATPFTFPPAHAGARPALPALSAPSVLSAAYVPFVPATPATLTAWPGQPSRHGPPMFVPPPPRGYVWPSASNGARRS